jgi:acetyl-CoA carboxylase biotin carboxyl carrier protein
LRRRLFQPTLVASVRHEDDGRFSVTAPAVGLWRLAPEPGTLLQPGMALGQLEVLGRLHRLEVPEGAHGLVLPYAPPIALARMPVAFGQVLAVLDPTATAAGAGVAATRAGPGSAADTADLVFRSPSSGRFYGRPGPDKPPFVSVGEVISSGHTVALLEVMKTFNRIQYGGSGLPVRAKVLRIVPTDDADLSAGDPILELEAAD